MIAYKKAGTAEEYEIAAALFREYAVWLNIDLGFQNFEAELRQLQHMYALPAGGIILCRHDHEWIGCAGIRKINSETAELKRMYVRPAFRQRGIATELLNLSIALAKECNYNVVRLDTLSSMKSAIDLYSKNGFVETNAYYNNPLPDVVYFQKSL